MCDRVITTNIFTTKASEEVFKIKSVLLDCNSEKVLYLLRSKFVMTLIILERLKQSSVFDSTIIKVNTNFVERENRMYHRSVFIHTLYKTATTVLMIEKSLYLRSVKRTKNLKKEKHFGNTD